MTADVLAKALAAIDKLEARARRAEARGTEPIAVTGVGCRLPGGVDGPDEYWDLLAAGRDGTVPVPVDRWDPALYRTTDHTEPGTIRQESGGYLTDYDPAMFDAGFFGVSARDAAVMDPQHRLLLEVTWSALEHAGIPAESLRGTDAAVYFGLTLTDYLYEQVRGGVDGIDAYTVTGAGNFAAGRVAHFLGLRGPSMVVDSACSSSLVAIHLACQALRAGETSVALAGGVNFILSPELSVSLSRWGMLSPDGRCKTFDAAADGFARGEGCGVVVLKRLSDAVDAGDRVLAVVRGTAVNHDGHSSGLTVPNGLAQRAVVRAALERSGLVPDDVDYVEAHGTGTALGDPIELEALADVYQHDRTHPLIVGSVKTNIGHLESAAGVAGFIKTVLSLDHGVVPQHLHFHGMTPNVSTDAAKLVVPATPMPWPRVDRPGRAGISSFGASGTNAHVIVERATVVVEPEADTEGSLPLVVSAATSEALVETSRRLADWLSDTDQSLEDIAFVLAHRRTHLPARLVVHASGKSEAARALREWEPAPTVPADDDGPVFVFSGQGAQWPGMGGAFTTLPEFGAVVAELDPVVTAELGMSLRDIVMADGEDPQRLQPTLFATHLALARAWANRGVRPAAVIGHSMGEIAAAVVAGALSGADGMRIICRRSRALHVIAGHGGMALVELGPDETRTAIEGTGLTVAILLGPAATAVAGPADAVARFVANGSVPVRSIKVDVAYHCAEVDPVLPGLRTALADIPSGVPSIDFYSTVTSGQPAFDAQYWTDNLRNPVRLTDALAAAALDGFRTFVEISPHPVLALADSVPADALTVYSARREHDPRETLTVQAGVLYRAGRPVDWTGIVPCGRLVDVPGTVFRRERHWLPATRAHAGHPLLGAHVEHPDGGHIWQNTVSVDTLPWLADHVVEGAVVLPASAYCEMALAAARAVRTGDLGLADVEFVRPLLLATAVTVSVTLSPDNRFAVRARSDDGWTTHATGRVNVHRGHGGEVAVTGTGAEFPVADLYDRLRSAGQHHGPAFTGVRRVRIEDGGVVGEIALPPAARAGSGRMVLHPVVLDMCLQLTVAAASEAGAVLPVGFADLRVFGDWRGGVACRVDRHDGGYDLTLVDANGAVVLTVGGVRLAWLGRAKYWDGTLFGVRWQLADTEPGPPGTWRVIGTGALADSLRADLVEGATPGGVVVVAPDSDVVLAVTDVVRDLVTAESMPRLVIVSQDRLEHAPLRGLVRVIAYEHPGLRVKLVEGDTGIVDELGRDDGELEVSLRPTGRWVARVTAVAEPDTPPLAVRTDAFRLETAEPGVLDAIRPHEIPRRAPGRGEVEIEVRAAGLNFSDVLKAMGLYPTRDGEQVLLGSECVGVVRAVGEEVDLAVGAEVLALAPGGLAGYVTLPAELVAAVPDGMSTVEAATIPVAYCTAWYALRHVGRLRPGERVLIHAATGGVGLAAVAIAQLVGATVYATAGRPEKRDHLRALGVELVMDSRTLDFVEQVRAATGGEGVDVVLNSLSGEALRRGIDLLAPGGRFVELGKKDVHSDAVVGLREFAGSASFSAVDLALLIDARPKLIATVLSEVLAEVRAGTLKPLPARESSMADAPAAFHTMAAADHIGKLVLTVPDSLEVVRPAGVTPVRADGGYIVTGGMGGLGLVVARWLVGAGARLVVLNGRSTRDIGDLARYPNVRVVTGDVAEVADDLVAAMGDVPLRGVVHAAAVFDDAVTDQVDAAALERVWRPKVAGGWALHEATKDVDLDWFVVFSSAASMLGSPGQGAYAAANAWLDALVQWRRSMGLPGLAVNWGPWAEVGSGVGFHDGAHGMSTAEGVAALAELLRVGAARQGVITLDPERWFASYPALADSPYFADLGARAKDTTEILRRLAATPSGPRAAAVLGAYVMEQVRAVLRSTDDLDPDAPLTARGLDSLLTLELRNRLEAGLALRLPATLLWTYPTVNALVDGLLERLDPASQPEPDIDADLLADILDSVELEAAGE